MPARRLSLCKNEGILRLKYGLGLKNREIARRCSDPSDGSIPGSNRIGIEKGMVIK
jgi:hypothetical protein